MGEPVPSLEGHTLLILVGEIPYIGNRVFIGWRQGLVNRRRRPNCPAGIVLVLHDIVHQDNSVNNFSIFPPIQIYDFPLSLVFEFLPRVTDTTLFIAF